MTPVRFKMVIAYDGTAYQGWQIQKIGTGVQQKLEEALAKLFPTQPRVHSSSRTDTGVHAQGMVVHFDAPVSQRQIPGRKLALALNAWLPADIRVVSATRAHPDFHARFTTTSKQYRYYVWNHAAMNPLLRHTAWHVPRALDLAAMRRAARAFEGKHDFRSFAANPGYARATTVRTVLECSVKKIGPLLTFVIEGDGFLYRMCRGIVGTLVQVGLGKFSAGEIKSMLTKKDRRMAGMSAPAHGLVLWKVRYKAPDGKNRNSKRVAALHEIGSESE